MREIEKFSDLIGGFLAKKGLKGVSDSALLLHEYEKVCGEIFGEESKKNTKGKFVKGGVLYAAVTSPVWAQKIYFEQAKILEKLEGVKEIRTKTEWL